MLNFPILLILFFYGLYLSLKRNSQKWEFFMGISVTAICFLAIVYTVVYKLSELGINFFIWVFLFIFGIWAFFFTKHWH